MNNIRYIVPDAFFDGEFFIQNVFVRIHKSEGTYSIGVVDKMSSEEIESSEYQEGIICNGLTNAHTHTELSDQKDMLLSGQGMTDFIEQIKRNRAKKADSGLKDETKSWFDFQKQGIDNVIDIRNGEFRTEVIRSFKGNVLTFFEFFSPKPEEAILMAELATQKAAFLVKTGFPAFISMHSPYSLSKDLRAIFARSITEKRFPSTIHFMESKEEREMFDENRNLKFFTNPGFSPIDFLKTYFPTDTPLLLVHNLLIRKDELEEIAAYFPNAFFVLCPLSNDFIHGDIPDVNIFMKYEDRILIGTDSLASNRKLDLIAEASFLSSKFPDIRPEFWFKVLSRNGGNYFNLVFERVPHIKRNKKGLTIIKNVNPDFSLRPDSYSERLL